MLQKCKKDEILTKIDILERKIQFLEDKINNMENEMHNNMLVAGQNDNKKYYTTGDKIRIRGTFGECHEDPLKYDGIIF